jgi:hypothetical protein
MRRISVLDFEKSITEMETVWVSNLISPRESRMTELTISPPVLVQISWTDGMNSASSSHLYCIGGAQFGQAASRIIGHGRKRAMQYAG